MVVSKPLLFIIKMRELKKIHTKSLYFMKKSGVIEIIKVGKIVLLF